MITELQRSTATEIIGCASEGEASCRCLHSDGVRTRQHRGASTGGTSRLEFALVAPMVFILLFAVFDFARLFYVEMNLQNAVREAGRFGVTGSHLSDPNHPGQNLSRVNSIIQVAQRAAMGFREFWIEGRDFYLNGSRIYLSAIPLDNGQLGPASASYDGARATFERFKSFGINFVYTHNYGCEPGTHISFEEVLRAADDEGMLVSFSQPHFGQYDWVAPDAEASNGYAQHAEFYVRVAQNHPSVVCYSTSHNSTGYSEDMNPDMIDGIQNPRDPWALGNASRA